MVKLLIVDDESFIRQGIRQTIPWESNGIAIVGEASNGEEALQMAIRLLPDIVLADIEMPVMNGLELAKRLNELLPRTRVVILTAYGNTENFAEAIEVKVCSFVIKNADSSLILSAVLKVKDELLEDNSRQEENTLVRGLYQENQQLIKSTLLKRFFRKEISAESFQEKAKKTDINLCGPYYSILLAQCVPGNAWQISNHFYYVFQDFKPVVFWMGDNLLAVIFNTTRVEPEQAVMEARMPQLVPYVFGNSVLLMHSIELLEEFPVSYELLEKALDSCFWNTDKSFLLVTQDSVFTSFDFSDIYNTESALIATILTKNSDDIARCLEEYHRYMRDNVMPRTLFLQSISRIVILINAILDKSSETAKLLELIGEVETPNEIMEMLASMLKPTEENGYKNGQFAAVLDYIDKNYNQDVKLSDVAKAAYISTGYLSRIFKSETGYSFKEWVNRVRIDKAKMLIASGSLKYYEIAERVGYKDYKYFSAYFSKFCGCSAKEYKGSLLGKGTHSDKENAL